MSARRQQPRSGPARTRAARPPTIKDVARAAGVGIGTASRALGSGELVSPATRERVRAAAERAGYRPSRAAKVLRGVRPRIIGVMIPDLSLPLYAQLLRGAGEVARRHDYLLLVCDGQNSRTVMDQQLERLYGEQIDGLIVAGPLHGLPRLASFVESGIPVAPELPRRAAATGARNDLLRAPSERPAALAAFRHLVALGHRRIAYLAYVERETKAMPGMQRMRVDCLREALASAGAALDEGLVARIDVPDACSGWLAAVLGGRDRPTAIIAGTEALTPFMLAAVAAAGLRIPDDVSVLAFGDSPWERAYRPPLSVVRFDYVGAGRALVENAVARIEGKRAVQPVPAFPSEFVDRGSCAPPPTRRSRARRG